MGRKKKYMEMFDSFTEPFNCRPPGAVQITCKKLGVIVENFAQEWRKFSSLRTIGCYGRDRIKQWQQRNCRYDTIDCLFCHYFRILPQNPHHTSSHNYFN